MRIQTLILLLALFIPAPALAQDAVFPTQAALAHLEIPAFRYAEMVGRMSDIDPTHVPPANPPAYEVGARDAFWLAFRDDYEREYVTVELRGMTERVLIWAQTTLDYPNWRALALAKHLETAVLDPMQRLFQFAEPPGVDGDSRLNVVMIYDPEGWRLGYFSDILEMNLMNAAGEIMAVSRECTVTTTHVLNFRASPNGDKIGLVPKAAALDALDREGDWFKVDYAGRQGWIHADYAHTAGKCP